MFPIRPFTWLMAFAIMLIGCSDPTPIGSGLLEQDQEDVVFTDTVTVDVTHSFPDSIRTYAQGLPSANLAFGTYEDPFFGTSSSEFYLQITPGSLSLPVLNDFDVDSVILVFEIDTLRSYGVFGEPIDFELSEMTESFDADAEYYSDQSFAVDGIPVTNGSITVDPELTQTLISSGQDTLMGKMVKIALPDLFGKKLLDTALIANFDEGFFGLHMKNTSAAATAAMAVMRAEPSELTSLNIYYTNIVSDDTSNFVYRYLVSPIDVRTSNLSYDATGSQLAQDTMDGNDDYLYLQGLHGPDLRITLPHITELGNILINSAVLSFTVAERAGDDLDNYSPPSQLLLTVFDEDLGYYLAIDDVGTGFDNFGGNFVEEADNPDDIAGTYRLNLSNYFQKIVDGTNSDELFLQVFPKNYDPARVMFFGNGALKPKLELTYTRINP